MGFLDELGGKITNVSNQVTSKAKDGAEQLKINSEISNLQSQITQHYQRIGSMYYAQARGGQGEQDYESELTAIDQLNALIAEKQARSEEIKAKITCSACGVTIAGDYAFCPNCGAPLMRPASTAPAAAPAPTAEAAAPETPVAPVEEPAAPAPAPEAPVAPEAPAPVEAPAAEPAAPAAAAHMCPKCGAPVEDGALFCMECGTKL